MDYNQYIISIFYHNVSSKICARGVNVFQNNIRLKIIIVSTSCLFVLNTKEFVLKIFEIEMFFHSMN